MIVKKVAFNKNAAAKSKALHVRDLCDYIAGPEAGDAHEKVEHRGAVNLLNLDHDAQVREVADLAETARRSPQPVQHWILSWRQGEQPTTAQADDAVRLFLDEMGLLKHQAIYALHRNTDNYHLHLAVNRVHPETERVVTVNGGFDLEVAHRAIARIEHQQGWQPERGARYQVVDQELVRRAGDPTPEQRQPTTPARDFENLTGQKSAQQIAIDEGAALMRRAHDWREMHSLLTDRGMRFEKKGSGAILWVGEVAVKASTAGRDCSMTALEKRLGSFVPAQSPVAPRRTPEPVTPAAPAWDAYMAGREAHDAARKEEREGVSERQRSERRDVAGRHRQERQQALQGDWRGKGAALNAVRSVLAARQAQEKAALKERHQLERTTHRERFQPWPVFEVWLRERGRPELAERWRFRDRAQALMAGSGDDDAKPRDIRAFVAEARGGQVLYRRADASAGSPSFVDRGPVIQIYDQNKDTVLAALQLSAQKWRTLRVSGSDEYKRKCVELAAEHDFRITNPELQKSIAAEREQRQQRLSRTQERLPVQEREAAPNRGRVADAAGAYERHVEAVRKHPDHRHDDVSRIDALVAVRLRVTGYGKPEVERAIREGAARLRPHEVRDWGEYARRAAGHAFGVSGERDLRGLANERNALFGLEGRRPPSQEPSLEMPRFRGRDDGPGR